MGISKRLNNKIPDFEISTFAFPGEKTGQEVTVGAGDLALSISSLTKHKKRM